MRATSATAWPRDEHIRYMWSAAQPGQHFEATSCAGALLVCDAATLVFRKDLRWQPSVTWKSFEDEPEGRVLHMELPRLHTVLAYVPNSGDSLQRRHMCRSPTSSSKRCRRF